MDIVSKQQSPPPLFCPLARFVNKEDEFHSVHFGEIPTSLSSFSYLHLLDLCNNKDGEYTCLFCHTQKAGTQIYSCKICHSKSKSQQGFHKECIEPVKHPYHPKHYLRLIDCTWLEISETYCLCCFKKQRWLYRCSVCDFSMCPACAIKPPLFVIDHPKRHEHTLFHFPKKCSLIVCDVCGLSENTSLIYSCRQCDFVAHKACAYFPCILKISRHGHRLSYNSSLTREKWSCGVCRGKIDTNYGRYVCMEGCGYGVHPKCATREDVWDGRELEGIPEDPYEDIKPFNEISYGIIQHFSHQNHHMRLDDETSTREFDENKRCRACTLPICDDIIFSCMQCDFILHQKCALLPRKKHHAVHPHPFTLQVVHPDGFSTCTACCLKTNGFVYLCREKDCHFLLDVCCASMYEPLYHRFHPPHPLFFTYTPLLAYRCSVCHTFEGHRLNCGECGFVLCFRCAALPSMSRYKHDKHSVILFL